MVLLIKITEAWKQSKYRDPVWCLRRRHPATQNISPTSCPLLWLLKDHNVRKCTKQLNNDSSPGKRIRDIVRENNAMFDKTLRESAIGRS